MQSSAKPVLFLLAGLLLFGCAAEQQPPAPPPRPPDPPEVYRVKFQTTKGDFVIEVRKEWAERAAEHFFHLVYNDFYDGVRFHRVVRRYIVQWGISGNPKVQEIYGNMKIRDDERKTSNERGTVAFAKLGPNSRTTQVFINLRDNQALDEESFVPFGEVVEGMDTVESLWSSYGEVAPRGSGPDPTKIMIEGNAYLDREFPRLDSIIEANIVDLEKIIEASEEPPTASE